MLENNRGRFSPINNCIDWQGRALKAQKGGRRMAHAFCVLSHLLTAQVMHD
ncbi:hypothetical protein [Thalassospira sp. UBA848]|uniref:hypothetical protein n=1 Tax=Thalassospira sp. UBA848 TaxID=1947677 RepID=UPI0025CBB410|nr:hypothetical protein [Thalassospira sp. UBA848]|tara:strand:+ start:3601 stop:3753 length:153 start_codon:yes stop_codon:yes gene_type:complete